MSDGLARTMPGTTHRNGMPAPGGYVYRGTGSDRDASPAEIVAQARAVIRSRQARAAQPAEEPAPYWPAVYPGPAAPGRCEDCGYMPGTAGHQVTCGGSS